MTTKKVKYNTQQLIARHSTLDWDALRANYRQRLQQDIEAGVDNKETRAAKGEKEPTPSSDKSLTAKKVKPTHPSRRGENLRNHAPKHDWQQIKRLYEVGLRPSEIAAHLGCGRDTVRYALIRQGVELRPDAGGVRRKNA